MLEVRDRRSSPNRCPSEQVRNGGIFWDPELDFTNHITRKTFYHLKNISKLKSILSQSDAEKLVHAFVSSRLDHCNLAVLPRKTVRQRLFKMLAESWLGQEKTNVLVLH